MCLGRDNAASLIHIRFLVSRLRRRRLFQPISDCGGDNWRHHEQNNQLVEFPTPDLYLRFHTSIEPIIAKSRNRKEESNARKHDSKTKLKIKIEDQNKQKPSQKFKQSLKMGEMSWASTKTKDWRAQLGFHGRFWGGEAQAPQWRKTDKAHRGGKDRDRFSLLEVGNIKNQI